MFSACSLDEILSDKGWVTGEMDRVCLGDAYLPVLPLHILTFLGESWRTVGYDNIFDISLWVHGLSVEKARLSSIKED